MGAVGVGEWDAQPTAKKTAVNAVDALILISSSLTMMVAWRVCHDVATVSNKKSTGQDFVTG
jgi:hypothetical protein